jgi:glycogen phosphorylase
VKDESMTDTAPLPSVVSDESPSTDVRRIGPAFRTSHPLASGPVVSPPNTVDGFVETFLGELNYGQGTLLSQSTVNDQYLALARTVRRYLMADWLETGARRRQAQQKTIGYLSAEYLLGRQLGNNLLATNLQDIAEEGMRRCGIDIATLRAQEVEPGLGNGGLGRLAACFVDSLATMDVPCIGYGIRYEYGIFRQTFEGDRQVELPDSWLSLGSPWEFPHPERQVLVGFGGSTETTTDDAGVERCTWTPDWQVLGMPYHYMVPGFRNSVVNTLRLWSARATQDFDLQIFNSGDYAQAVRAQTFAENISKVLYPEDSTPQGKELRLQQQYFFVACSLHDFIDNTLPADFDLRRLHERIIFQLNDTHPVIAIPELMRILMDRKGFEWDEAWEITQQCFAYTCHTLLPEALEVWSVDLLGRLLPRHLEIIYRINEEFLERVREAFPGDEMRARRMSIIAEHPQRAVRMAYLATVAGAKVNGVAELHSQLLRDKVLPDFSEMWPDKFTNVTNGITPRRFVRLANRRLSDLLTDTLGDDGWVTDLDRLRELEPYADDAAFREEFRAVKRGNKERLVKLLKVRDGLELSPDTMLDVMVKRLHEYKRQTLKLLHIVSLYDDVVSGRVAAEDVVPRTFVFGAKAAPGYHMAKEIIFLINAVSDVVNADPRVAGRLAVAFPANYNVTLAEKLIPAADLSEQISLAGKEASGTGNMKFALNGALTIGTDDGANVEIRRLVGDDHFFLFGMTEPEVERLRPGYSPSTYYEENPRLRSTIDLLASGHFTDGDRQAVAPVIDNLLHQDAFMALADFQPYLDAQARVDAAYRDEDGWSRSAILNVARSGFFSSDRSMRDYLERIWHA